MTKLDGGSGLSAVWRKVVVWFLQILTTACGGLDMFADSKSPARVTDVKVAGQFAEWGDALGVVGGGYAVMLQSSTGKAFWSSIGPKGGFVVAGVEANETYYFVVLGRDYRLLAHLESASDSQGSRRTILSIGEQDLSMGTLTVTDGVVRASRQQDFGFLSVLGVIPPAPVAFAANRPTAEVTPNPDIDLDGLPNWVDADWDGDGVPNLVDDALYGNGVDTALTWQQHYGLALGGFGYITCSWLAKATTFSHLCTLDAQLESITGARLVTDGTEVEFSQASGAENHGLWSLDFSRDVPAGQDSASLVGRLALVSVTLVNGKQVGYVVPLGGAAPYTVESADAIMIGDALTATLSVNGWDNRSGVRLQALVTNAESGLTRALSGPLVVPTTALSGLKSWPLVDGATYDVSLRLLFPSPMAGVLGSAVEAAALRGISWTSQ